MYSLNLRSGQLEPMGPICARAVLDQIKVLTVAAKYSENINDLMDIANDVALMEHLVVEPNVRSALNGVAMKMRERIEVTMDPVVRLYSDFLCEDNHANVKMIITNMLLSLAADIIVPPQGEIVIHSPVVNTDKPTVPHYVLKYEMLFDIPKKCRLSGGLLRALSKDSFQSIWRLLKAEWYIRMAAINPIRKIQISNNENPGEAWGISEAQYHEDIQYLQMVYRCTSIDVLRVRWEWGRRLWSIRGKRYVHVSCDEKHVIEQGRIMEIEARKELINLGIICWR